MPGSKRLISIGKRVGLFWGIVDEVQRVKISTRKVHVFPVCVKVTLCSNPADAVDDGTDSPAEDQEANRRAIRRPLSFL
jgi:hypothetical protein